jgi:hypothetical protein
MKAPSGGLLPRGMILLILLHLTLHPTTPTAQLTVTGVEVRLPRSPRELRTGTGQQAHEHGGSVTATFGI